MDRFQVQTSEASPCGNSNIYAIGLFAPNLADGHDLEHYREELVIDSSEKETEFLEKAYERLDHILESLDQALESVLEKSTGRDDIQKGEDYEVEVWRFDSRPKLEETEKGQ